METSSSINYKLNWEGGHIETVYLWWNRDRRRKNIKIKKRAKKSAILVEKLELFKFYGTGKGS